MKMTIDSYKLIKPNVNYNVVAETLRGEAMIHSVVGDTEQFYMPGGKVALQLRKANGSTFLDVKRIGLLEPRYVREIVNELGGEWCGGDPPRRFSPDSMVKWSLILKR